MQGIIVAAGVGSRLKPYSDDKPKCLLEINGNPIIYYIVRNMLSAGIQDITIVVGYRKNQIIDFLSEKFPNVRFTFIENTEYANTNNAYSLLLAHPSIHQDFILSDSDIMFQENVITKLKKKALAPSIAIKRNEWDQESIKVALNESQEIIEISKEVSNNSDYFGESVGLELFSYEQGQILFKVLQKRVIEENRVNEFYEASFQEMICDGMKMYPVDIENILAMEIDCEEDLQKAKKIFE